VGDRETCENAAKVIYDGVEARVKTLRQEESSMRARARNCYGR